MTLIQGIGDDDDAVASSSTMLMETDEGFQPVFFEPRELRNLALIDELESLCPLTDVKARAQISLSPLPPACHCSISQLPQVILGFP